MPKTPLGGKSMPDVTAMTPEEIADMLGEIREVTKGLKKKEGFLKEALLARAQENAMTMVQGATFGAVITVESQSRLDTEAIRRDMSEKWISDHSKGIEFFKVTTKRL